jgi:hypothetical protein
VILPAFFACDQDHTVGRWNARRDWDAEVVDKAAVVVVGAIAPLLVSLRLRYWQYNLLKTRKIIEDHIASSRWLCSSFLGVAALWRSKRGRSDFYCHAVRIWSHLFIVARRNATERGSVIAAETVDVAKEKPGPIGLLKAQSWRSASPDQSRFRSCWIQRRNNRYREGEEDRANR